MNQGLVLYILEPIFGLTFKELFNFSPLTSFIISPLLRFYGHFVLDFKIRPKDTGCPIEYSFTLKTNIFTKVDCYLMAR